MASNLLLRLHLISYRIKNALPLIFGRGFPPESLCLAACPSYSPCSEPARTSNSFGLKDLIGDGFMWAVPTHRRTIEKRTTRRNFLQPSLLTPKKTLRVCNYCGHDHEIGRLCPNCYKKVQDETKVMQDQIINDLGLKPDDKEVVVLYDGEKKNQPAEFWNGKRVVEMVKHRPLWFSKNLLQKTTQQAATTKEVKTSDLG